MTDEPKVKIYRRKKDGSLERVLLWLHDGQVEVIDGALRDYMLKAREQYVAHDQALAQKDIVKALKELRRIWLSQGES